MGKKHKKDRAYAIDCAVIYYGQERLGKRKTKSRWKYFETLPKAVRFARKHGLPAGDIRDADGNLIPPMDLDGPIYRSHAQLRCDLEAAERQITYAKQGTTQAREDLLKANRRLLLAGLVPLQELRTRIAKDMNVTNNGDFIEYDLTMRVLKTDQLGSDIIVKIVNGE